MNRANMGVSRTWYYGFDLDRQLPDAADPVAEAIRRTAQDGGLMENGVLGVESLSENRGDFYGSYGSLFFLGILLSVGFSLAAVLIICISRSPRATRTRPASTSCRRWA
ncbi:MAG: hypothetical protein ACLR5H_00225 [Oscillospiraceae bacterium]